jgi:hypothetical protein
MKFDGQNIFIDLLKEFHNPILFKTDYCTSPTKIFWLQNFTANFSIQNTS